MAIGATQEDVQRMILRQAAALAAVGATLGVGLAAGAHRLAAGIVEDVSVPPAMVAGMACALVAIVLLAAWRPARRAARIDPAVALKTQ